MQNISIKDIAKLAGVSVATVSRVINNNGRFSEATRKKVEQVIQDTGYETNYSAKNLRMNRSDTIGILIPDISNFFFAEITKLLEDQLFTHGYSVIICNTAHDDTREKNYLKTLASKGIDGLIVISGSAKFTFEHTNIQKNIPYVCVDRQPEENDETIFISSDHFDGGYQATTTLFRAQCKNPVIAIGTFDTPSMQDRLRGFKQALQTQRVNTDDWGHVFKLSAPENIEQDLVDYLQRHPDTDGIFAVNDSVALKLQQVLRTIGRAVPEDIKLIGFDNSPTDQYVTPTLSSVAQNNEQLATQAVHYLLGLINQTERPGQDIIIPVSLRLRDTTRR
ncbi:LacI family DNA-binding transcriptional regulator [Lactiplantibacillus fabifermentans]|uniref:LacI family transcription regulator n=2 Tax=Lactiplantibacillus fabifermentans TaxID=483011 RepID=A0A0R2NKP8_9LACO|nr:LacI family DNA-binding transcriptional regulator [Lactiplantibacillus fabifermentans]ETY72640.1 LacI family transcriptional regulator [Lactiplantibacillus fabifermentans T30PCM01]KRO23530.1 LacI family transcription regulator [Lactiplantibacillus fabifermentans DSM 21115]